jgi:hypothetical protein
MEKREGSEGMCGEDTKDESRTASVLDRVTGVYPNTFNMRFDLPI